MNSSNRPWTRVALIIAAALGAISCGGGGGGDSQIAGIDRLGVSSGTITGFGSIFVNGVEWQTSGATITVDDNPGTESELKVGQVVTVRGTLNAAGTNGTADSVEFDNSVEGPITSIDPVTGSFVVLGQTVLVSADTDFDDNVPDRVNDGQRDLNDLAVSDDVEVSGYRDSNGAIRATRVEIRGGGAGPDEVKGSVSSLGGSTFQIGSLVVNYASATLTDFGSDMLSNGDLVEVKGSFAANLLTATIVQREDSESGGSGDEGELEGYITRYVSPTDFDVAGVRVTTDGGTEFEGGNPGELALNLKVEVEGKVNSSGVLVADKMDIRVQPDSADVELEGDVDDVNASAGTVTLQGLGITVKVNAVTRLEDQSNASVEDFSLANLVTGDHIEVHAAEDATTGSPADVIATRLERRNPGTAVVLRGPIQSENPPEFTVVGVTVATGAAAFRDQDDNSITAGAFFSTVSPGDVVKAKTDALGVIGNVLTATEVEIEEDD